MRTFLALLILFSSSAWCVRDIPTDTFHRNLLKRCDDGNPLSCYDYAKASLRERGKEAKARGNFYMRRACKLAYQPACERSSASTIESRPHKIDDRKIRAARQVCATEMLAAVRLKSDGRQLASVRKGSQWDRSGVQAGDSFVSIDGEKFRNKSQLNTHLVGGKTVVNLARSGRETSIMLKCP